MAKRTHWSLVVLVLLIAALAGCGGGGSVNDGTHDTGEVVQVGDLTIVMDSASLMSHRVRANFTIENQGASDLTFDGEAAFTAKGDNTGTDVPLGIDPTCTNVLSGVVPAGGSLSGQLCWRSDPSSTWPETATITYAGGDTDTASWTVRGEQ